MFKVAENNSNGSSKDRGSSKIVIYLDDVTEAEVEDLGESIADLLVAKGKGHTEDDEIVSIVGFQHYKWPEDSEEVANELMRDCVSFLIPMATEDASEV